MKCCTMPLQYQALYSDMTHWVYTFVSRGGKSIARFMKRTLGKKLKYNKRQSRVKTYYLALRSQDCSQYVSNNTDNKLVKAFGAPRKTVST